jgi:hypothetical protein
MMLPPGWERILDEIRQRLAQALESTETPGETSAEATESAASLGREQEWAALCQRLEVVQARTGQVEDRVHQADLALEAAELNLQAHAAASAALRQRMADWAGRAIG